MHRTKHHKHHKHHKSQTVWLHSDWKIFRQLLAFNERMITRRAGRFTWTLQASRISNCNMFSTIPILCSELKKHWKHEVLAPAARVEVAHKQPGSSGVGRNRGSFCAWESRRSTPLRYASSNKRRSSTVRPQKLCFVTATNVRLSWESKYMIYSSNFLCLHDDKPLRSAWVQNLPNSKQTNRSTVQRERTFMVVEFQRCQASHTVFPRVGQSPDGLAIYSIVLQGK